ncbi:hypothetical protein F5Y02DRAFT_410275 [Annulohypoxylon stygium]|nr:hypothetical protein F5Y02DRAFT_410275 [Annulohypoxylon stygium]
MLISIFFILGLVRPILASAFQLNCTIPPESASFVRGANVRGTLDILWTSLFTLFTCCWTVQHLNIPRQVQRPTWLEGSNDIWRKRVIYSHQLMKFYFFKAWPKIKWTLLTLVIPEVLVGKALEEWYLAKKSVGEFKFLAQELGEDFRWIEKHWTTTHGFYANMGGFVLKVKCKGELHDLPLNCMALRENCRNPRKIGLSRLKIPRITDEEINDKSKCDLLIKVITIGQLVWFVIQIAVRGTRGLAISELEIAVLAYAACTVFVFFLCLSKPKDIRIGLGPLPNDAVMPYSHTRNHVVVGNYVFYHIDIGCTIAGVVFGGIHCAAWGSHFPTPTDQFLWQIASVCTTSLLPMITLCKMMDFDNPEDVKIIHYFLSTLMLLLYLLYIITRLYLVVEVFRTLYFLPSSAFVATWTSEIPHIA